MLNMVKLYHWKTDSFSQHKATDELYESLNLNIDRFVEVLMGKGTSSRIHMVNQRIQLHQPKRKMRQTFYKKIKNLSNFLFGDVKAPLKGVILFDNYNLL